MLIEATEKSLTKLQTELEEARGVSATIQLQWIEAEARCSGLQDEVEAVSDALAALKGEKRQALTREEPEDVAPEEPEEETPEEFEQRLKRERAAKEKEAREQGPYAGVQCSSCGETGTLYDSVQALGKAGRTVPIIACRTCGSIKRR